MASDRNETSEETMHIGYQPKINPNARTKVRLDPCVCNGRAIHDYMPGCGYRVKCSVRHCKTCTEWKASRELAIAAWGRMVGKR